MKKGLSIQEFASLIGKDYSYVVKYETDKRNPKDSTLRMIGDILDVSWLLLKYGEETEIKDKYGKLLIRYIVNK